MPRTYTLKQRAQQQAQTRDRIVEAAIDLHASIGPAATTFSMVAERAGVQRHTLYAHFPDERSLLMACSGVTLERDPLPDPAPWRDIADPRLRLRAGLAELYAWYERNASLAGCVLRDAECHALTGEIISLRFEPTIAASRDVLGARLGKTQRALLLVALSFATWRSLVQQGGLGSARAAEAMADAIHGGP